MTTRRYFFRALGAIPFGFSSSQAWAAIAAASVARVNDRNISVAAFGAVGDGVTDDTAAITAALNGGASSVLINDGMTYIVSGLTITRANQRIYGNGTLKLKDASNRPVISVNASGVEIEGIIIDGNKANQIATTDGRGEGVWIAMGLSDITIRNNRITNTKRSGIGSYGNTANVLVDGNKITFPGFIGIMPSTGSAHVATRWKIVNNDVNTPGQDGIGTVAIQHSTVANNTIYYPTVAGIAFEARCDYSTVTGNTVHGRGAADVANGIQVNDSLGVSIVGNNVYGCGTGIVAGGGKSSHDVAIIGNTLRYCGAANGSIAVDGSRALAASFQNCHNYGATISGNSIRDSHTFGIMLNAVTGVTVTANQISEFAVAATAATAGRFLGGIVLRAFSCYNTVGENNIVDTSGSALRVGILEVNDGGQAPSNNLFKANQIRGPSQDICVTISQSGNTSSVERPKQGTSAPTTGTWARGQIHYHNHPASGGHIGWVSTDARGGSFGSFSTTGSITSGKNLLVVASTDGLFDGMSVSIAGAGPAAAELNTVVLAINRSNKAVTLLDKASITVGPSTEVKLYRPTFKSWGIIE